MWDDLTGHCPVRSQRLHRRYGADPRELIVKVNGEGLPATECFARLILPVGMCYDRFWHRGNLASRPPSVNWAVVQGLPAISNRNRDGRSVRQRGFRWTEIFSLKPRPEIDNHHPFSTLIENIGHFRPIRLVFDHQ